MRFQMLGPLFVSAGLLLAVAVPAAATSLPIEENEYLPPEDTTTYKERSLRRQGSLTIEHPYEGRRRGSGNSAAMAGFCHEGGLVRRRGLGLVRQREICENVAPRTLAPGDSAPRPRWTGQPSVFQPLLDIEHWFAF